MTWHNITYNKNSYHITHITTHMTSANTLAAHTSSFYPSQLLIAAIYLLAARCVPHKNSCHLHHHHHHRRRLRSLHRSSTRHWLLWSSCDLHQRNQPYSTYIIISCTTNAISHTQTAHRRSTNLPCATLTADIRRTIYIVGCSFNFAQTIRNNFNRFSKS